MRYMPAKVTVDLVGNELAFEVLGDGVKADILPDIHNVPPGMKELFTIARAMVEDNFELPARLKCNILLGGDGQVAKFVHVAPIVNSVKNCRVVICGVNQRWITCQIPAWRGEELIIINSDHRYFRALMDAVSKVDFTEGPIAVYMKIDLSVQRVRDLKFSPIHPPL